jgi:hypothetical protein
VSLLAFVALALTVEAPPALAAAAERVRAIDRQRLEADLRGAGLADPGPVHVTLLPESDPGARRVPSWLVGQAFGRDRVVILPGRVTRYPYDSLESVVRHEVAHLALTATARGWPLPRWFHEGVATSVDAGWGPAGELRLLLAALTGPTIDDVSALFASESRQDAELAYLLSAALVASVQERHGRDAPGRIAERSAAALRACVERNAARIAACDPRLVFTQAFEDAIGETPGAAAAIAWRSYRTGVRWVPALASAWAVWTATLVLAVLAFVARRRRRRRLRKRWAEEDGGWPPSPPE